MKMWKVLLIVVSTSAGKEDFVLRHITQNPHLPTPEAGLPSSIHVLPYDPGGVLRTKRIPGQAWQALGTPVRHSLESK